MSQSRTLDVGGAVHKDSRAVASVAQAHGAEVSSLGTIGPRQADIDHLTRKLQSKATHRVFVDEAGPCGYWLSRSLHKQGYDCWVVAPSLSPKQAGERVNTDRREAMQLARLMRAGDLTPVDVPKVADEAIRDLGRARADAIRALKAAQFRLNAFLPRHDIRSTGRAPWSPAPLRWLSEVVWPTPAQPRVFQDYGRAVNEPSARLQRLARELHAHVPSWPLPPVVEALQALRGVQVTVAVTTVAALGDLTRFDNPRELMKFLGLIPAEYARGARRRQGARTKAGNPHARRALVEGAWASRDPANVRRHRQLSRESQPKALQDSSWKAHVRRCTRDRRLLARGKHATQVVVAMARALGGCIWAMANQVLVTPSSPLTTGIEPITTKGFNGEVSHVHGKRRSPGVGSPSTA